MNNDLREIVENIFGKSNSPELLTKNKESLDKLLPSHIYKFRALNEYAVNNLCERTLWFDSPLNMNDPYDGHLIYENPFNTYREITPDFIETMTMLGILNDSKGLLNNLESKKTTFFDLLKKLDMDSEVLRNILATSEKIHEQGLGNFNLNFLKKIYICSFSERFDSILMWAHYTNNHSGFCIEYDISKSDSRYHFRQCLYPVIYDENIFDLTSYLERDIGSNDYNNLYIIQAVIRKALDWSYEHEWRIIHPFGTLNGPQNLSTPKPSSVLLGSNFFNSIHLIKDEFQKQLQVELALKIIKFCEQQKIILNIARYSLQKFLMERDYISYDDAYRKLREL
ncbi:TPA: DUF2971 domain-containing protein [Acinetobacter baumannii]